MDYFGRGSRIAQHWCGWSRSYFGERHELPLRFVSKPPGRPSLKPLIRYKSFPYQADSAPAHLGAPGAGGLAERWATPPERAGSCSSNRCERSGPSSRGAGAITGGVDEREVPPTHDCAVCNIEQPLKSGCATVAAIGPLGVPSRETPKWKSRLKTVAKRHIFLPANNSARVARSV
jgi:hypothetical protein